MKKYETLCSPYNKDFIFKDLDIPEIAIQQIRKYCLGVIALHESKITIDGTLKLINEEVMHYCPDLKLYFETYNLKIDVCKIMRQFPDQMGWLHADDGENDLAINIGIEGHEDSYVAFYDVYGDYIQTETPGKQEVVRFFKEDVKKVEIARYYLTKPKLFNNKIPHDIFNKLPHRRIVITFRFGFDVDYQKIF
jgi:hypothetical protein